MAMRPFQISAWGVKPRRHEFSSAALGGSPWLGVGVDSVPISVAI